MEPWLAPRDGLHLPIGSPRAYVYEDISKQFPKGALLWEINGVAKPREDTSTEGSPRVYDCKPGLWYRTKGASVP